MKRWNLTCQSALLLCHGVIAMNLAGAAPVRTDAWFQSEEGQRAIENVLGWQSPAGSWPKNSSTTTNVFTGDAQKLKGTFDNGATTTEMRLLAGGFRVTKDARCEAAFLKGLIHVLEAQYPNGGWPQYYPVPAKSYARHITFNDGSMARIMELLRDVSAKPEFEFVPKAMRQQCAEAFIRGVSCILKCQIAVNGELPAWCAQHDEVTFEPRHARSYELVSLSGAESAGILRLLMSIEQPSAEIRRAVEAGVAWFKKVQVNGLRETKIDGDKAMVKDPSVPALWARFYEIGSNRPIFSGRNGVKKYALAEIEHERRNGYSWYGTAGESALKDYVKWKAML